jgi:crotonobetainyl-CoA:carnitine CoA-transferase CaiB-like acyl-CoA transferase
MTREQDLIGQAWTAVSSGDSGTRLDQPTGVRLTGAAGNLPSHFAVEDVAIGSVAAALLAAAALTHERGGPAGTVSLDRGHVSVAVRSERFFRVQGRSVGAGFAPLSRFWRVADGWVRTHANYPWHRHALLRAMGIAEGADAEPLARVLAGLPMEDIEERVFAAGGIATGVRTLDAWLAHPQGRALAAEPLIGHHLAGDGPARPRPPAELPLAGVRVLDLTRVIAGPVCTRFLSVLGAEVLRVDPPSRPDMRAGTVADNLLGKRSSLVDLGSPAGIATLHDLLSGADVVVCGYRPGALDRFGLAEEALAERHPGTVAVFIDAWGHTGPWAHRRGFDSVVQAPTGISMGESSGGDEPAALPCQLLDHATGYLAAAAALDGLRRQELRGGTQVRRLSLARTALWLTSQGRKDDEGAGEIAEESHDGGWLVELDSGHGPVSAVAPPGALGDDPLRWPFALTGYGNDEAAWRTPS